MVDHWLVPENLDQFRRMLVYRGAGLDRFHCTYVHQSAAVVHSCYRTNFQEGGVPTLSPPC